MSTHVCLVSRQPLPNLLGVLTLPASHVVLLTTDAEDAVRVRLQAELEARQVTCTTMSIDPFDPARVRGACRYALTHPPSPPVMLNATGGTKIAALSAVAAFQAAGAEAFYVNTDQQCIQWLLPADRPPIALGGRISLDTYLGVHGVRVAGADGGGDIEVRGPLSAEIACSAARAREVMQYFRKLFYVVDADRQTLGAALASCADSLPPHPGPVSRALLRRLAAADMVTLDADEQVTGVRSVTDLGYLGGGRWLEEHTYLTVRDAGVDEVRANLQVRWGSPTTVENEIDVAAVHASRLYLFSCKTGGVVASARKDDIGQEEIFKLEALVCRAKTAVSSGCESHPAKGRSSRKQSGRGKEVTTFAETLR